MIVGSACPMSSDYDEDHIALTDSRIDVFTEVDAEWNVINVPENSVRTKVTMKAVANSTDSGGRIVAAIGDEDLGH